MSRAFDYACIVIGIPAFAVLAERDCAGTIVTGVLVFGFVSGWAVCAVCQQVVSVRRVNERRRM